MSKTGEPASAPTQTSAARPSDKGMVTGKLPLPIGLPSTNSLMFAGTPCRWRCRPGTPTQWACVLADPGGLRRGEPSNLPGYFQNYLTHISGHLSGLGIAVAGHRRAEEAMPGTLAPQPDQIVASLDRGFQDSMILINCVDQLPKWRLLDEYFKLESSNGHDVEAYT